VSRIGDIPSRVTPSSVAHQPMGSVFDMRAGKNIRALAISPVRDDAHPFPCYGGNGVRGYVAEYSHDGEYLLIGRQGALSGNVKRTSGKFYATEHAVVTEPRSRAAVDVSWAFHLLTAMNLNQYVSQGAQPGLAVSTLAKVVMPVPPIGMQREIARVLDLFSGLEADLATQLNAELAARQRQFSHYRDGLFTFGDAPAVKRVPMGEVGEFIRGRRFTKNDVVSEGIPSIHYGEIYTTYGIAAHEAVSHVRKDLSPQLRYAKPGDVIIAAVGETVEDVGKAVAWLGTDDVAIHDDCFLYRSAALSPKFVSYFLRTEALIREKDKYVARAKVKRLSGENLAKLAIPIPSLNEQQQIVATLDKFDALVADLSATLPAEVTARRTQYEYYRDLLLTFKELAT
jgi:type I restriction enzyme, S subunit